MAQFGGIQTENCHDGKNPAQAFKKTSLKNHNLPDKQTKRRSEERVKQMTDWFWQVNDLLIIGIRIR